MYLRPPGRVLTCRVYAPAFGQPGCGMLLWARERIRMIARMLLEEFVQVCREELHKAAQNIAAVYETIREADERALAFLITMLRGD